MIQAVIGKSVDSWCGCCRLMLAHTVEAMVNHKITRTHCNTCGAQHAYRRNRPGTASAKARGTSSGNCANASGMLVSYEALLRGKDVGKSRAYRTSERFQTDEIVDHPTFGIGLVVRLRDGNKIDVGFSDGVKTLTHGASV